MLEQVALLSGVRKSQSLRVQAVQFLCFACVVTCLLNSRRRTPLDCRLTTLRREESWGTRRGSCCIPIVAGMHCWHNSSQSLWPLTAKPSSAAHIRASGGLFNLELVSQMVVSVGSKHGIGSQEQLQVLWSCLGKLAGGSEKRFRATVWQVW